MSEAFSAYNYGHWLLSCLGRLLYLQERYDLKDFDHFLVTQIQSDYQWETLAKLGIPREKVVQTAGKHFKLEDSVVTNWRTHRDPKIIRYLRDKFTVSSPAPARRRRLYISREDAFGRQTLNESEVLRALSPFGFEKILLTALSFEQQVELFKSAEAVIACHGSGLANLVFCTDCSVIEIFPHNWAATEFWEVGQALDLNYFYLFGEGYQGVPLERPHMRERNKDIVIPIAKLLQTLTLANLK